MQMHSLDAHLNFPYRKNGADRNRLIIQPNIFKEWSRQEQIDYTTEYIQKTFVDNGNLFRGLGKDSIADQSAISLIICATGICWNQVVCKRMAGSQRISLKQKYRYFIGTICIYFRANKYYHISMKGECV